MVSVEFIRSNDKHLLTMAFKLITVLCATLAFTNAGHLTQTAYSAAPISHYSSAPAVSHVYSSIGAVSHQKSVLAHGKKNLYS